MPKTGSTAEAAQDEAAAGAWVLDWSAILPAHERWLRGVITSRLHERQAVDEVMQEVALAAVAQRSPVLDPRRVIGWLYRLAVRQSLLYRRKAGRQRAPRRSLRQGADSQLILSWSVRRLPGWCATNARAWSSRLCIASPRVTQIFWC